MYVCITDRLVKPLKSVNFALRNARFTRFFHLRALVTEDFLKHVVYGIFAGTERFPRYGRYLVTTDLVTIDFDCMSKLHIIIYVIGKLFFGSIFVKTNFKTKTLIIKIVER